MQFDDDALRLGAEQGSGIGGDDGGTKRKVPYKPRKTSPRVAPRKQDAPANPAGSLVPASAVTAPFVGFIPTFKEVEPAPGQGDEQGTVKVGRHGKAPTRKVRGKYKPYVPTGNKVGANYEFVPTPEQRETVIIMLGMLVPKSTCARLMGCSPNTFEKVFAEEIVTGPERFIASLKGQLWISAQKGSVRAQTFLLEKLGGPEWAPRMGMASARDREIAELAAASGAQDARVTLYLPDNKRLTNDGG